MITAANNTHFEMAVATVEHDVKHSVVPYTVNASSFRCLTLGCYFGVVHPKAYSVIVVYARAFTEPLLKANFLCSHAC